MREMTFNPGGLNAPIMKSTLISIVPFPIIENKPGLIPGEFKVDACTGDEPQFSVIGECIHYVYIDISRGNLKVLDPSYEVASSIVSDYNTSQLAVSPGAHPGFFWAPGEWNWERMKKNPELMAQLDQIREIQRAWFERLVQLADDDWEKMRSHWAISDTQRYACRALDPENKRNRPWIMASEQPKEEPAVPMAICPACYQDVPQEAVICRYCTYILNEEKFSKMSFANKPGPVAGVNLGNIVKGVQ